MSPSAADWLVQGVFTKKDSYYQRTFRSSSSPLSTSSWGGGVQPFLSFYNLARSDTFLQCICRFHLLLLSLMSVHLINLTVAFIPLPLFPPSLPLRKFSEKKVLADSRGHQQCERVAGQNGVDGGAFQWPYSPATLSVQFLKTGSRSASLIRKHVF